VEVDLARLARALARRSRGVRPLLLVGHLAHLLPVSATVVLRCHPVELRRRLDRARRGRPSDRDANAAAEAIDLILLEAIDRGGPVWEVDTTGRRPSAVAREVERLLARAGPSRVGRVRWLNDPSVTDFLLRGRR
jgi:adenylate kinase